jgi:hypothetical protein
MATEKVDPRVVTSGPGFGLPVEMFINLLTKYPTADSVVSLAGPPQLSVEEINRWPRKAPRRVVVQGLDFSPKFKPLIEKQVIQLAIYRVPAWRRQALATRKRRARGSTLVADRDGRDRDFFTQPNTHNG